jgi:Helix-turn-helix domain
VSVTEPRSPYLTVEDVAARYRCSVRTVHELTRTLAIPHRRLPGSRRCLFLEAELELYDGGTELEVREQSGGGRVVRPVS